ncbi:flagellar hook-associated protein FlgL [Methylicorpusculum sp.]|uniref:flagellar hook-associated protein FlgL n=1 Tax=Methylicorpusculum sp. TaxID=2713644 RepID=UPI0027321FB1|nr:flagellar hook-associated protein FlgL [Methylicorpusculum sp.]MDP2178188.1 flagellar hook-associated protein FlgL [Methylicorpusculum sp.]MDP3530503.1 flagellar hook-associated protein FlgL [Methylicorpusculum sp.]
MRISTAWAQQLGVNAMQAQQAKMSKTQMQLSSGLKQLSPSDDPSAAARVLDLEKSIEKTSQYQANIFATRGRLNIEESALESSENVIIRAKELTVQALNGTLNASDRLAIKQEVDQLIQELAGLANTKNANGEFIFSGDLSNEPTYAMDPDTGKYVYQGGVHQRALSIGPERQVADGDLGSNVFENIASVSRYKNEDGKRSIFNTLQALSDSLAGDFKPQQATITGDRFLRYGLAAGSSFDLVSDGGTASIALTAEFTDLDALVTEINSQIEAQGMKDNMQARTNGNKVEFVSLTTGINSTIKIQDANAFFLDNAGFEQGQSNVADNVFLNEDDLRLNNPEIRRFSTEEVYNANLGNVLTDLDSALDSFLQARTSVGARLRALDDQESQNDKFIIDTRSTLSATQDLDYAEAISRFNLQQMSLQAAQQAFSQVQRLSLFNYL